MAETKFEHNFNQNSQYSGDVIDTFEATFGKNYMSAGGHETSLETARLLAPVLTTRSAPTMLDIGCGIGGAAVFFATEYGATVKAVDVNRIGIDKAIRMLAEISPLPKGKVDLEVLDVTSNDCEFADGTFDIIYSRDVMLHFSQQEKEKLFAKFQKWLKPGGMVCICDYCLGPRSVVQVSEEFQTYLDTRGYHLLSPKAYKESFVQAGFDADFVESRDEQLWYCQMARTEIDRVLLPGPKHDAFLKEKSQKELEKLSKVYEDKINMTLRGDRSYVMVIATKTPAFYKERQQVADAYRMVSKKNLIMSCDGNVSARSATNKDKFLITPSGVDIPSLTADKVVLCSMKDGKALPGETYKPSSESRLHDCIYRERPDVGAIVHTHSIYACALACCRLPLPPAHYATCELLRQVDFSSANGGSTVSIEDTTVKCADYHTYGTKALAEATLKGLGENFAVLMANHGALVVGPDMETALYNADRLERECEIYWRCVQLQMVGPPKPLTMPEIESLQKRDQTYGQDHKEEEDEEDADPPALETLSDSSSQDGSSPDLDEASDS
eukprot:scaffold504_cov109-Cylindrotheca_fusiformis.AAC.7